MSHHNGSIKEVSEFSLCVGCSNYQNADIYYLISSCGWLIAYLIFAFFSKTHKWAFLRLPTLVSFFCNEWPNKNMVLLAGGFTCEWTNIFQPTAQHLPTLPTLIWSQNLRSFVCDTWGNGTSYWYEAVMIDDRLCGCSGGQNIRIWLT